MKGVGGVITILLVLIPWCYLRELREGFVKMQFLRLTPMIPVCQDWNRTQKFAFLHVFIFPSPHTWFILLHCKGHLGKHFMKCRIEAHTSSCCRRKRVSENVGTSPSIIQGISLVYVYWFTHQPYIVLFILVHTKHDSGVPMC